MLLLALSIAPGIAICLYIFLKDRFNTEPKITLIACFLLGCAAIIPAILIQTFASSQIGYYTGKDIPFIAFFAFIVVALSEELSKYMMLRLYAFPKKTFDEPYDGIVYSVMVGMGFATAENIGYVMQSGLSTALLRMFLSVPAHATFAILMGYFVGKAKFNTGKRVQYLLLGIFWATFFHGMFDFFLFLQQNNEIEKYVSDGLLFTGAVASFIVGVFLSKRAIREHVTASEQMFPHE